MVDKQIRWVARLTPTPTTSIEMLLGMSLGLDVWERRADRLIVAASQWQLAELERRRLAEVERLYTVAEFIRRSLERPDPQGGQSGELR